MTAIDQAPAPRAPIILALKDATLAALVALGLFVLMIGLHARRTLSGRA
jgi:hypothetical protein